MATLGDHLRKIWKNYIAPTKAAVEKGRREEVVVAGDFNIPEKKSGTPFSEKLSTAKCIEVAEQCPLFMKAARKKTKDSLRAWHRIEHIDKTKQPFKKDLEYINQFIKRNNLKSLWRRFRVAAYTTGDGFLLITFDKNKVEDLADAPSKGAIPYKVQLLNSKYITEIGFNPNRPEHKDGLIKSFHFENSDTGEDFWIYPDRIIHMTNDHLFGEFGNSKVNLLRNIIKSSVNIDIAVGEILAWFAHSLLNVGLEDANDTEIAKWEKIVNKHPGAYIHGKEEAELEFIAPEAIDPKPFYEYIVLSIAASFFMPTHILTGIQVGKVTGAEVGTGDYVKDLKDDQELDHTPLLDRLYKTILKANGRSWDNYEIVWNPIYIDELSEADIMEKRVRAAEMAFNGTRGAGGFIDLEEARRIFNDGQIALDPKKKVKTKEPMQTTSPEPSKPSDNEDGDKEESIKVPDLYEYQCDVATKAMIEKRKLQIAKERKLAEEQENAGTS